jgi:hypothetical protein
MAAHACSAAVPRDTQSNCAPALDVNQAASIATHIDKVITNAEYQTALTAAQNGRCDRTFVFGRGNGQVCV